MVQRILAVRLQLGLRSDFVQGALAQPICANAVEQQMAWATWQSEDVHGEQTFENLVQRCEREVVSVAVIGSAMRKQAEHIVKGQVPVWHCTRSDSTMLMCFDSVRCA